MHNNIMVLFANTVISKQSDYWFKKCRDTSAQRLTMMMNEWRKITTPTKERKQSITQAPTQNIKVATFAPGHLWSITKRQRSKIWRHFTKFRDSALSQHHFLRRIRMMETSAWRNILDWWSPAYQGVF